MIHSANSVVKAIEDCDNRGRDEFLQHYGFQRAKNYFLIHNGREYDSKAIFGVAYGIENPTHGPLSSSEFSGGWSKVGKCLEQLGFEVRVVE